MPLMKKRPFDSSRGQQSLKEDPSEGWSINTSAESAAKGRPGESRGSARQAPVGYERKHSVTIPYKHHETDLIIKQCHESLGHVGQEYVLPSSREVDSEREVGSTRVIGTCMNGQRQRKACPGEQFIASLPENRLVTDKVPFTYIGNDHFGPLEVQQSRVKRYGCLFTCLTTRAVHIEIAHSFDDKRAYKVYQCSWVSRAAKK